MLLSEGKLGLCDSVNQENLGCLNCTSCSISSNPDMHHCAQEHPQNLPDSEFLLELIANLLGCLTFLFMQNTMHFNNFKVQLFKRVYYCSQLLFSRFLRSSVNLPGEQRLLHQREVSAHPPLHMWQLLQILLSYVHCTDTLMQQARFIIQIK